MLLTLTYIIKSSIVLAVLYLYYLLVLRRQTLFTVNRFYLLSTLFVAVILPFIRIDLSAPIDSTESVIVLPTVLAYVNTIGNYTPAAATHEPLINLTLIYFLGILYFSFRYIWAIIRVLQLRFRYPGKKVKGLRVIFLPENTATFSFFSYIFLSKQRLSKENLKNIFEHEKIHVRQMHSLDLFITEMLCILNWYNPLFWIIKNAILQNHEYIADQQVIRRFQTGSYLLLLVNQTFKGAFSFTNYFCCSNLKKRMIMMTKKQTQRSRIINLIPAVIIVGILFISFSCNSSNETNTNTPPITKSSGEEVFVVVEDMPEFLDGNVNEWLANNVTYPPEAREKNIEGKVYVQFIIEKDGSVSNVNIVKGKDVLLDNEALRVVKSMPKWKPGKQRGQKVKVSYTLPVNFALSNPKDSQPLVESGSEVFVVVETMPTFPGGNPQGWIAKNIKYPVIAVENGIQGKVYLQFVIEKDGSITNAKVIRGIDTSIDNEALRVIKTMPNWNPGKQRGNPVRVTYTMPIAFSLGK